MTKIFRKMVMELTDEQQDKVDALSEKIEKLFQDHTHKEILFTLIWVTAAYLNSFEEKKDVYKLYKDMLNDFFKIAGKMNQHETD